MRKYVFMCIATIITIVGGALLVDMFSKPKGFIPGNGVVPNEATAIKVAEAIWLPIYGDGIYAKQPFKAEYDGIGKCWYVHGSLPANTLGGVPEIKIRKSDGLVIYIGHSK